MNAIVAMSLDAVEIAGIPLLATHFANEYYRRLQRMIHSTAAYLRGSSSTQLVKCQVLA